MATVFLKIMVAVVSGLCIGSGWIEPAWIWPPWVAIVLQVLLARTVRGRAAFGWGWAVGWAGHFTAFHWIPDTVAHFSTVPLWIAWGLFALWSAFGSVQLGAFNWLAHRLRARRPAPAWLLAACWVALAMIWPTVFPWRLAQSQLAWSSFVQIIELTGPAGVGFIMVWVAVLVADGVYAAWTRSAARPGAAEVLGAVTVWGAAVGFGVWRSADLRDQLAERPPLRVGLVQCGDTARRERLHALSRDIAADVDLLCWPEAVLGRLDADRTALPLMLRPVPDRTCALVMGVLTPPPAGGTEDRWYNSAILVDADETILGRYHKRMLIPFGEYIPGDRWFPSLRRFSAFKNQYRAGTSPAPLDLPDGPRLGVLICYEDIVARLARASTAAGATLLVNVTNDRWFGDSPALRQHLQLARLRAIENRRYLLRSTMTGVTAIVDPLGAVTAELPTQEPAALVGTVQALKVRTLYTACGEPLGWLCLVVVATALLRRRVVDRGTPPDAG